MGGGAQLFQGSQLRHPDTDASFQMAGILTSRMFALGIGALGGGSSFPTLTVGIPTLSSSFTSCPGCFPKLGTCSMSLLPVLYPSVTPFPACTFPPWCLQERLFQRSPVAHSRCSCFQTRSICIVIVQSPLFLNRPCASGVSQEQKSLAPASRHPDSVCW